MALAEKLAGVAPAPRLPPPEAPRGEPPVEGVVAALGRDEAARAYSGLGRMDATMYRDGQGGNDGRGGRGGAGRSKCFVFSNC